ncbi:MAG: ABC-F family ATP-binding cassette domain-containing protein [Christensenellaceae bacterium]|nr:ABC-F family ATP-binding cassette domain-containing protein [Christensenellaceae bacterium]
MLVIKNLSIYLKKDMKMLIKDFSLSINKNDKIAIIGEEGNGKSTLLKAIYKPELLDYAEISGSVEKQDEHLAYFAQQEDRLNLSSYDYLHSFILFENFNYKLYYTLLDDMQINENLISTDIMMHQLSGGEKVKIRLLANLMKEPTVLLLDEPSNDLDLTTLKWLENFINNLNIPLIFISHDEVLLENCANGIIHIEQIKGKSDVRISIHKLSYSDYIKNRQNALDKQLQISNKEKAEFDAKMDRYRQIYQKVEYQQNIISRQDPAGGRLLKKKMHSIISMGKRFEKEKENLTERPSYEQGINLDFDKIVVPKGKRLLDFKLDKLYAGDNLLSKDIYISIFSGEKIGIIGENGVGKTTLLKQIIKYLQNNNISYVYMPQNYNDVMDNSITAIDFLRKDYSKDELTNIRRYLGSIHFTRNEMLHNISELSSGQKAKLFFAKMTLHNYNLLVLDEPTRNLSPLSGPEVRKALREYGGSIISISHDRKYLEEVCDTLFLLDKKGIWNISFYDL